MDHMVDKAWNGETAAIDPTLWLHQVTEVLRDTHSHTHTLGALSISLLTLLIYNDRNLSSF